MADRENRDTEPKSPPAGIRSRLIRHFSNYGQATSDAHKRERRGDSYAKKAYQRTKNEAWSKPIETIGVVVVSLYTAFAGYQSCQMREANKLTHQIISSTQAAMIDFRPSIQWDRNAVEVEFLNVGKVGAPNLSADITFQRVSLADGRILQNSPIHIRKSIVAAGAESSRYILINTKVRSNAAEEMPRFDSEYWRFSGSFSYEDGFQNQRLDPLCVALYVEKEGTGWASNWSSCEDWKVLTKHEYPKAEP